MRLIDYQIHVIVVNRPPSYSAKESQTLIIFYWIFKIIYGSVILTSRRLPGLALLVMLGHQGITGSALIASMFQV